jgi:hypothetical protein
LTTSVPVVTQSGGAVNFPLSFAQQRLWFLAQIERVSQVYHVAGGFRLSGRLDVPTLRRALNRIVDRHETFRTTFATADGEPVQRIGPPGQDFTLAEERLQAGNDLRELEQRVIYETTASFDLEGGPLCRGRLFTLAPGEYALFITLHHIISDGWSLAVLIRELGILYAAFLRGDPDPLPRLSVQYVHYAVWQRRRLAGKLRQLQHDYWSRTLVDAPPLLELPLDHPRPARQSYGGGFVNFELTRELTLQLQAFSRRHGTTLFTTLLAVWALLLARLSGQDDIVIGTPAANRDTPETAHVIGLFVNTLPLRVNVSDNLTLEELVNRVKIQTFEALSHQDLPFEEILGIVQPPRLLAYSPLFQTMFSWQNTNAPALDLPELRVTPLPAPHIQSRFDLSLLLSESDGTIGGGVEYATSLFERSTIERWTGYLRSLLVAMVTDEKQEVKRVQMLSQDERRQVLYDWSATLTRENGCSCLHDLITTQARLTPDSVAVVYESHLLTYTELERQATRLGRQLQAAGVEPERRVAICVDRGLEMVIGLVAILKAGAAYVPIEANLPPARIRRVLDNAEPAVILTRRAFESVLAVHRVSMLFIEEVMEG